MEERAAIEQERAKLIDKLFACCELVVYECIVDALTYDVELHDEFVTHADDLSKLPYDVIGFYIDEHQQRQHLIGSVTTLEPGHSSQCQHSDQDEVRRVCSMLYDGINMVFASVVGAFHKTSRHKINGLTLKFDNESMAFKPYFINFKLHQFNQAKRQVDRCAKMLLNLALLDRDKVQAEHDKHRAELDMLTLEEIDECEFYVTELNLKNNANWIYIVVEEKTNIDIDLCLSRCLPVAADADKPAMIDLLSSNKA
jgi:hypothetical protein